MAEYQNTVRESVEDVRTAWTGGYVVVNRGWVGIVWIGACLVVRCIYHCFLDVGSRWMGGLLRVERVCNYVSKGRKALFVWVSMDG